MSRPAFSVEVTNGTLEFNVLIRWENGVERRVSHFSSAQNAQVWIEAEAENWLKMRHATPDFPPIEATGEFVEQEETQAVVLAA